MLESLKNVGQDIQKLRKIIERKNTEIKKLENEINKFMENMVLAETKDLSEKIMKKANERSMTIGEIKKEIEVKEAEIKDIEGKNIDVEYVVELLNNVGKIIKLLDKDKQKSLLRKLIKEINVNGKHIDSICFNFNDGFRIESSKLSRTISNVDSFVMIKIVNIYYNIEHSYLSSIGKSVFILRR